LNGRELETQLLFKTSHGTVSRPLGDKTPLPNRLGTVVFETPLDKAKVLKPSVLHGTLIQPPTDEDDEFPESVQRPSSLRKHLRLPSKLSSKNNFEDLMNKGNDWDTQALRKKVDGDEIDLDEIEYCPPNMLGIDCRLLWSISKAYSEENCFLDLPYQPPFDFNIPDYREVGKTIRELAFSFPFDDVPGPPDPDFPASELDKISWDMISLPPLGQLRFILPALLPLTRAIESDDPFDMARMQSELNTKPTPASSQNTSHRRIQSSLASLGTTSRNPPIRSTSRAAGAVTGSIPPARTQPPKPASAIPKPFSNSMATKPIKSTLVVKTVSGGPSKTTAMPLLQSRVTSGRLRPHTSLSLDLKTKTASLPSRTFVSSRARSNTLVNALSKQAAVFKQQGHDSDLLHGVEDFMFDV